MKTTITTQDKIIKEQKNVELALLKEAKKRIKEKDVSGALKNAQGWNEELQEAERAFYMQVGNRVVVPDHPQPIVYDDLNYF